MDKKLLGLIVLIILLIANGSADTLVELPNGVIRGREATTLTGKAFHAFQRVPFAAPPLGNLRFQAPLPAPAWEGVLNTTENNVLCYQMAGDANGQSEDCLYLNVFTPQLPTNDSNPAIAVMLYIFGGGFIGGNCLIKNCGPEYLLDHDLIIVTINYRLGPFGFLSTEDVTIPGNAGLKDQQLAIQWTHDNIHLFGGDPGKVLIFGESSGSASVTYHLLNKKNEGLFRAAICESGTYLNAAGFQRNARKIAFQTAGYINDTFNDSDDSEALLEFLQNVSAEDIHEASSKIQNQENMEYRQMLQGYFYAPVVETDHDGAFITDNMYATLKSGNVIKVPILMGINSEEAIADADNMDWFQSYMETLDDHLDWLVPSDMRIENEDAKAEMGKAIKHLYTNGQSLAENLPRGIRYLSDTSLNRGIIKFAQLQSLVSDVYFYQFSYDGELGNYDAVHFEGDGTVAHVEEVRYIWRMYGSEDGYDNSDLSKFPEADGVTQRRIQRLWTDFAKTLNPTPEKIDLLQNVTWPTVLSNGQDDFVYLDINENLEIKQNPKGDTFAEWVGLYDSLGYDDFDTY